MSTTTAALAEYVCGLRWQRLSESVRRLTRQAFFDSLCCIIAGAETEFAAAHRLALSPPPSSEAQIIATGEYTSSAAAAYHNAVAANALDLDDVAACGAHPGASVVPAALAVAERLNRDGVALLTALVAGYETTLRVSEALRPTPTPQARIASVGIAQVFGATVAAGLLLGLAPTEMQRALGFAASLTPLPTQTNWQQPTLSWVKDNLAWPAEAGVRAAHMAAAGLPASSTVLDGDTGFWQRLGSDRWRPEQITVRRFRLESLGFKTYPCCHWLHPILDALDVLLLDAQIHPQNIRHIEVATTTPIARHFGNVAPRTLVDAQYSAPHAIAMRLLNTPVDRWWWFQSRHDPAVQTLMKRVSLVPTTAMDQYFLALDHDHHRVPARLSLSLVGGGRREAATDLASGAPGRRRLSDEVLCPQDPALAAKYRTLLGQRLGPDGPLRLATAVEWLENGQIPSLMELLFTLS